MPLLSLTIARALVPNSHDDTTLQWMLDTEEAQMIERCGPHPDGTTALVQIVAGDTSKIYMRYPIVSVSSATEATGAVNVPVLASFYQVRSGGVIERLYTYWGGLVTVTYVPADQRPRRQTALLDLLRLALNRTAMKSESVAGEYSYTAADWDTDRAAIYRSLGFMEV